VSAVEDNLAYDKEELILEPDPAGRRRWALPSTLGRVLRHRLNGIEAATYPDGPRSADDPGRAARGRADRRFPRPHADAHAARRLRAAGRYRQRRGSAPAFRPCGAKTACALINVTGDISEDDPARAAEIMRRWRGDPAAHRRRTAGGLPPVGPVRTGGEFLSDARTGADLCLTGIYLVLAWIFASWTRPVVVMAIIPFGLVGTIYGHWVWDVPLSMFTVVGLWG
jgi:hypothetical protein